VWGTSGVGEGDIVALLATGEVKAMTTTGGVANIIGVARNHAETACTVWVMDDPMTVFEIQSDGATDPGSTTAIGHIGNNAPMVYTVHSSSSDLSQCELDYSAITTGTADPLQIIGFYNGADNDKTLAHARYLVLLNKHLFKTGGARFVI